MTSFSKKFFEALEQGQEDLSYDVKALEPSNLRKSRQLRLTVLFHAGKWNKDIVSVCNQGLLLM